MSRAGEVYGSYRLERKLGAGGMGEVWLGRHELTGGAAAVKVLRASALRADATLRLFAREQRVVARLSHPHIVAPFEIGEHHLALAYVDGVPLSRRLRAGIDPDTALRLARQVASALAHAHGRGVLHLDVKPANVLLDGSDNAYLTDFGVAHVLGEDDATLVVAGTPAYMAPERLARGSVGPAADQYSLARTLLAMLLGRDGESTGPALELLPEDLPASLRQLLTRGLAHDPSARFPSMEAFEDALARCDGGGLGARLLPAERKRPPETYRWAAAPVRIAIVGPDIVRADYRLSASEAAGLFGRDGVNAYRRTTGLADVGFSLYGHVAALGRHPGPEWLARARELVVLLHGWAATRAVWSSVAPALCRDAPELVVLTPDVHGFGETTFSRPSPPREQIAPEGLGAAVQSLLRLLGVTDIPMVLVGHSLAGAGLLTVPERELAGRTVRVLVAPALIGIDRPSRVFFAFAAILLAALARPRALFSAVVAWALRTSATTAELTAAEREAMMLQIERAPVSMLVAMSLGMVRARPAPGPLVRTTFVLGVNDPAARPALVERMKRELVVPDDAVRWLATGFHHPHVESVRHPEWTQRNVHELVRIIDDALEAVREAEHASTELAPTEILRASGRMRLRSTAP